MTSLVTAALGASAALLSLSLQGCSDTIDVDTNKCDDFGRCMDCDKAGCLQCEIGFTNVNGTCGFVPTSNLERNLKHRLLEKKGLTLDDTTFRFCADKIPMAWPATDQAPVQSLRLFKAWQKDWEDWEGQKESAWRSVSTFVKLRNISVLMGTQISCNETDDDRDWEDVKALMQMLGPEHVMGLAVGNEMELFYQKDGVNKECIADLWQGGYFWRKFQQRAQDLDSLGMSHVPLTTVFGGYVLAADPFLDDPEQAMIKSWLVNATMTYGDRFVFSLNIYGYFDTMAALDDGTSDECSVALKHALCLETKHLEHCYTPNMIASMRGRMEAITKVKNGGKLWIGETGWSFPRASTLGGEAWDYYHNMSNCVDWSSYESFEQYYRNFLSWDLSVSDGVAAPDHVFYFSARDSSNFGNREGFGLVGGDDEANWCDVASSKFGQGRVPLAAGMPVAESMDAQFSSISV